MATLYLIATPIGNLGDITLRALDTLREVDYVASEDTRKTGLLLKHFEIAKPQVAFHEHNELRATDRIIGILKGGASVALVTNAGTPAIADPGYRLVRRAIDEGVDVVSIPGPSAFLSALIVSGLAVHGFTFRGFPPRKSGPRQRFLRADEQSEHTLIFYESPYRVKSFLADALTVYGDREAALVAELTKVHERVQRGKLSELIELLEQQPPRGEYTIVIAGEGRS